MDEILRATASHHGVDASQYAVFRSSAAGRDMAAWLCRRWTGATLAELGPSFGLTGTDSVSNLVRRAETRHKESANWRKTSRHHSVSTPNTRPAPADSLTSPNPDLAKGMIWVPDLAPYINAAPPRLQVPLHEIMPRSVTLYWLGSKPFSLKMRQTVYEVTSLPLANCSISCSDNWHVWSSDRSAIRRKLSEPQAQ